MKENKPLKIAMDVADWPEENDNNPYAKKAIVPRETVKKIEEKMTSSQDAWNGAFNGLKEILEKLGVESLVEAVKKQGGKIK